MEGEPDAPAPPAESKFFKPNPCPPITINADSINTSRSFNTTTCSSTTSSSSSSPPDFIRHIQAAFKRHRPLGGHAGMMQTNGIQPRRFLAPQRETPKAPNINDHARIDDKKSEHSIHHDERFRASVQQSKAVASVSGENPEDASITLPSGWESTVNAHESCKSRLPDRSGTSGAVTSSNAGPGTAMVEVQKKVHFSFENVASSHGVNFQKISVSDDLLSQMNSLALTEMERNSGNHVDTSAAGNEDWGHHDIQNMEMDNRLKPEAGVSSSLAGRTMEVHDQVHQLGNFLQNDSNYATTQSSAIGSSSVTSTLLNSSLVPLISTTYSLQPQTGSTHLGMESREAEVQLGAVQPSYSLSKNANGVSSHQSTVTSKDAYRNPAMPTEADKSSVQFEEQQRVMPHEYNIAKDSPHEGNNSVKGNGDDVKCQPTPTEVPTSDVKLEHSKPEKQESGTSSKTTSRKRGYDSDLFFKVNGKYYQRLGKIGSGGSSEVHKVISADCTIYALKKIKLKGRDYATAYGFCQEIGYLNRLKGKNNIIQLIDYEVTDKKLLQEVMNGSVSNKDGKVRDDGYIYMVLEYGEIDLAHMLAQKWKELDGSNAIIDENWLRFYWQQILLAVNTIHEERIVHSDLKPANFLLVRGWLKLIDFGIAKAIMNDTTNIQRDSQVGTLSYMSPEAFMCNEKDDDGNTIKCGRSSDIWSLGCILYQMVYGRTPFSEYKTFWAKFKVITDPNHEIIYEPVPNPWLLDLMRKCLVWDRNKRWRIPQLLQHPFLVPPIPPQLPSPSDKPLALLQLITEMSTTDQQAATICSQLQAMLMDPKSAVQPNLPLSRDQQRKLLCKISTLCFQLQEHLASL